MLAALREQSLEFGEFTRQQALQHRKTLSEPLAAEVRQRWQQQAEASLEQQYAMEAADDRPFAQFLAEYQQR